MIAVDTNLLARFYVDDPTDPEAARQRPIARRVLAEADAVWVPLTVVLELEWVVRAFYGFGADDFGRMVTHLCGLSHVVVEGRADVLAALEAHRAGLDFADALHHPRSEHCERLVTFDDRGFARRAGRLGLVPRVEVPR